MSARKVVACLYLDNQAEIGYPLETVIKSVGFADEWLFAASDSENAQYLKPYGRTIQTGIKIADSSDISQTMNQVRKLAFEHTKADVVVLVQADTMSTPEVDAYTCELADAMILSEGWWLTAADSQLYMDFQPGWGYSIVGRNWDGLFFADGLSNKMEFAKDAPSCLHIGYLSSALARRHRRAAAKIWNVPDHITHIDSLDDEAFIYWHLDHVNQYGSLTPIEKLDARFSAVIDAMGLREDQKLVHVVLERWKAAHP